jgi:hypothetical protein
LRPLLLRANPLFVDASPAVTVVDLAVPPQTIAFVYPNARTKTASYVNYDFLASPQDAHGNLAYGMRLGSGVAELDALARPIGDARGIMLSGLAWRAQSEPGNVLIIGDAQSRQGKYEESVRFDGVQYAGQNVAYDIGWERTDFGDSAMHFGRFMTEAAAWKPLGRFTAEAHLFADSSTKLLALGGTWATPRFGQLSFGIAPSARHGLTGYLGYAYATPLLRFTLDDRTWSAQGFSFGDLVPGNYRRLQADLQYNTSPTTKLHVAFSTQAQSGFSVNSVAVGYIERFQGAEMHVDLTQSGSPFAHNAGLATYFSLPLGGGRRVIAQNTLAAGDAARTISFKQDAPASGTGTSYALDLAQNGTSFANALVGLKSAGSTTQLQLSRAGGLVTWSSEFTGSLVFLGGTAFAANQTIDQSDAFDTLKGRNSVIVTIVDSHGFALPGGSIVRAAGEDGAWRLDAAGRTTLTDVVAGPQTLNVTTSAYTCVVAVSIPPNLGVSTDLGVQVCRRR